MNLASTFPQIEETEKSSLHYPTQSIKKSINSQPNHYHFVSFRALQFALFCVTVVCCVLQAIITIIVSYEILLYIIISYFEIWTRGEKQKTSRKQRRIFRYNNVLFSLLLFDDYMLLYVVLCFLKKSLFIWLSSFCIHFLPIVYYLYVFFCAVLGDWIGFSYWMGFILVSVTFFFKNGWIWM